MAFKINGNTAVPKINANRINTLQINGNTVWNAERIRVPALPFTSSERTIGDAVVFNNEIHFVGGPSYETKHYKFNGTSWVKIADFPTNYPGIRLAECTESNDSKSIHAIIPTDIHTLKHYKFNGSSWTELDPPPSTYDYIAYRDYYGVDNPSFKIQTTGNDVNVKVYNGSSYVDVGPYSTKKEQKQESTDNDKEDKKDNNND